MCDRSYEEDDAEDDEAEDTGYDQHRTRDLLNVLFVFFFDQVYIHRSRSGLQRGTLESFLFFTQVDFTRNNSPTKKPLRFRVQQCRTIGLRQ
ncbi:hypothetical protein ANTRET_LOCUS1594 [Anthophora retusa]